MNFQLTWPMVMSLIVNLTIVTCLTINESPKYSAKKLMDELVENGTLELLPGKHIIKLIDQITDGLMSKTIEKMKEPSNRVTMVGLSGEDVLRLVDEESSKQLSQTLNDLSADKLSKGLAQLKSNLSEAKAKRTGPDSMSGWTVGSSKRSVRSIGAENEMEGHSNKRNFDEIDRSGFSGFVGKRNFDEIDRSSGFSGFSGKRNFDEIDRGFSGFRGRRNFDEIDRSNGFSGFAGKREYMYVKPGQYSSSPAYFVYPWKRNFDEIDRSNGFSGFYGKRNFDEIDRGFSGFRGRRNFDEIDRSGFSGFVGKRNFDEIDRSGFAGFIKRAEPVSEKTAKESAKA